MYFEKTQPPDIPNMPFEHQRIINKMWILKPKWCIGAIRGQQEWPVHAANGNTSYIFASSDFYYDDILHRILQQLKGNYIFG